MLITSPRFLHKNRPLKPDTETVPGAATINHSSLVTEMFGVPIGLFITQVVLVIVSVFIIPLGSHSALYSPNTKLVHHCRKKHRRSPERDYSRCKKKKKFTSYYNIPQEYQKDKYIRESKVIRALMKFYEQYPGGEALKDEFLPGRLRPEE